MDVRKSKAEHVEPSASDPGFFLFIEDAHVVFGQSAEAALLAERIVTMGNQVGVGIAVTLPDLNMARFGERQALCDAFRENVRLPGLEAHEMFYEGD